MKDVVQIAKVAKIWDGTAWVDLATSVPNLSNYQLKSEGGLTFVKKQTIGTAVSSVTVTDAFSATYDAYKIIVTGGSGTNTVGQLRLGGTTTNYRVAFIYGNFGAGGSAANLGSTTETSFVYVGNFTADGLRMNCDLINPFLAKTTQVTAGYAGGGLAGTMNGELLNTTSYTDFNLSMQGGGTFTGGTIYVYGYNKG
jgi:hypothetical protein